MSPPTGYCLWCGLPCTTVAHTPAGDVSVCLPECLSAPRSRASAYLVDDDWSLDPMDEEDAEAERIRHSDLLEWERGR